MEATLLALDLKQAQQTLQKQSRDLEAMEQSMNETKLVCDAQVK
jgi:hypothetical protein